MANSYKRYPITLAAGVESTVLTVPAASTLIIRSVWVANDNAGTAIVELRATRQSPAGTSILVPQQSLNTANYLDLMAQAGSASLVLETGDALILESSVSSVYGYVSGLLVDRN